MSPSCAACQHHQPRTELSPAGLGSDDRVEVAAGGTCTEGPEWVDVPAGHYCTGRFRRSEASIRAGTHLPPTEILKHFEKAPR